MPDDTLEIRVRIARKGASSMTYSFNFRVGEREVAEGQMTSVCCVLRPDGPRSIPIPESIGEKFEEA